MSVAESAYRSPGVIAETAIAHRGGEPINHRQAGGHDVGGSSEQVTRPAGRGCARSGNGSTTREEPDGRSAVHGAERVGPPAPRHIHPASAAFFRLSLPGGSHVAGSHTSTPGGAVRRGACGGSRSRRGSVESCCDRVTGSSRSRRRWPGVDARAPATVRPRGKNPTAAAQSTGPNAWGPPAPRHIHLASAAFFGLSLPRGSHVAGSHTSTPGGRFRAGERGACLTAREWRRRVSPSPQR